MPSPGKDGYTFFDGADQYPIEETLDFRLATAHWMIDVCYLTYGTDGDYVKRELERVGFEAETFGWPYSVPPHILVAHSSDAVIISFRGTRVQDFADVLADVRFLPSLTDRGFVHHGFQLALARGGVWDQAQRYLADIEGRQIIFFTGHSLGAALATLARRTYRDHLGRQSVLYTFGSPRVGDELIYCSSYAPHTYRIVNDEDAIPHVPTPPLYGHVGTPLKTDGSPLKSGFWEDLERRFSDLGSALAVSNLSERAERLRRELQGKSCKPLGDHAPKSYGSKIWNALIAQPAKAAAEA
jgi:hypothetical protein